MTPAELEQHRKYLRGETNPPPDFPGLARVGEALLTEVELLTAERDEARSRMRRALHVLLTGKKFVTKRVAGLLTGKATGKDALPMVKLETHEALREQVRALTADNAALVDAARNYHEAWKRGTDTLALVSLLRLAREPHPGASLLAEMATLKAERDGYARTAAMVSDAGDRLSVTTAALEEATGVMREALDGFSTMPNPGHTEMHQRMAALQRDMVVRCGAVLVAAVDALKAQPARRFVEAEKVSKLEQALRDMLASADCEWENRKQGHDWAEACQQARVALGLPREEVTP